MNISKRFIFFLTLFIGFVAMAQRPSTKHVSWHINVKMTTAADGEVIIVATPADGWHLYGMELPSGGPTPTSIILTESSGVKFIGRLTASPDPVKYHDDMFNADLTAWEGKVTFRRKFKVTNAADASVTAVVSYMACNNVSCAPPAKEKLTRKIVVK